mmetsp:Transcript_92516/g.267107  ORF Transcript_92516/g.267107 Transcript_92516/m.267107 type:complete len:249 (-) Transcript_92516:585-1331(-)
MSDTCMFNRFKNCACASEFAARLARTSSRPSSACPKSFMLLKCMAWQEESLGVTHRASARSGGINATSSFLGGLAVAAGGPTGAAAVVVAPPPCVIDSSWVKPCCCNEASASFFSALPANPRSMRCNTSCMAPGAGASPNCKYISLVLLDMHNRGLSSVWSMAVLHLVLFSNARATVTSFNLAVSAALSAASCASRATVCRSLRRWSSVISASASCKPLTAESRRPLKPANLSERRAMSADACRCLSS